MRDDQTYITPSYMSRGSKGQIGDGIKQIHLYDDEYIELPYPIDSDEFNFYGPYLLDRVLFYEVQHMNDELNELRKKINDLLKEEE